MPATVLIVEDELALRRGMIVLLRSKGHSVRAAATVAEARAELAAASSKSGVAHPELADPAPVHAPLTHIILDLNLPDGLGTDLLPLIRAASPKSHILLLTGSANTDSLTEATQAFGVDAILSKPPDWNDVLRWANTP